LKQRILVGFLAAACWLIAGSVRADECDDTVIDQTGVLGSDGLTQVKATAEKLASAGAVVRVRVMETPGAAGTLDRYEAQREKSCPSWQDVSGVRRNTLISFLYQTTGGASGRGSVRIFFGEYWKPELGPLWMPILQTKVAPFLRSGQAAHGLVAGLDNLVAAATAKATAMPASQPAQTTTTINPPSPPTDLSGLWTVLKGLFLGLGLLLLIGLWVLRNRQAALRRAAQQTAKSRRDECASMIVGIDLIGLQKDRDALGALVPPGELVKMDRALAVARAAYSRASERNARLGESPSSNPDVSGLSAAEYEAMAGEYAGVLKDLELTQAESGCAQAEGKKLRELVESVPAKLTELAAAIDQAKTAATVLESQRYKTAAQRQQLTDASAKLDEARGMIDDKDPKKLLALVQDGMGLVKQAVDSLGALPKKKATLQTALASQSIRIAGLTDSIVARRVELEAMAAGYSEKCWRLVKDNVSEADIRLKDSVACLERGEAAVNEQDWAKADNEIGQAKAWLDQAESYLRSVSEHKANLDKARAEAPQDLANVETALKRAREFVDGHRTDLGVQLNGLVADLAAAGQSTDAARAGLAEAKPDYLRVAKDIGKAGAAVDKAMRTAQEEEEHHERLLARRTRLTRDASSAISAAREYIADHDSDVGDEAKDEQRQAAKLFVTVNESLPLEEQVDRAEQAMKQAKHAIKLAESDVEEEARRRRRVRAAYTPSSSATFVAVASSENDYFAPASSVSVFDGGGGGFDLGGICGGDSGGGGGFDLGGISGGGGGGGGDL
jgi:uncharacterized membrane protein YgcG